MKCAQTSMEFVRTSGFGSLNKLKIILFVNCIKYSAVTANTR